MGSFLSKYIMFELKNYRGVICDTIEDWCEIRRKTDLCFLKWHEQFVKFLFTHWKNSNFSLECKMMVELNQNKNSKQRDQPGVVWKLYFTLEIN